MTIAVVYQTVLCKRTVRRLSLTVAVTLPLDVHSQGDRPRGEDPGANHFLPSFSNRTLKVIKECKVMNYMSKYAYQQKYLSGKKLFLRINAI